MNLEENILSFIKSDLKKIDGGNLRMVTMVSDILHPIDISDVSENILKGIIKCYGNHPNCIIKVDLDNYFTAESIQVAEKLIYMILLNVSSMKNSSEYISAYEWVKKLSKKFGKDECYRVLNIVSYNLLKDVDISDKLKSAIFYRVLNGRPIYGARIKSRK